MNKFLESWWIKLILGLIGFYLAYDFAIKAIDSGSNVQYFLAIVMVIYGINRVASSIRTILHK